MHMVYDIVVIGMVVYYMQVRSCCVLLEVHLKFMTSSTMFAIIHVYNVKYGHALFFLLLMRNIDYNSLHWHWKYKHCLGENKLVILED